MKCIKPQRGVTLLEVLLVLAIMSSILVLSIRMYQSFKLQSDLSQVQANVDQLFVAMSVYYKVNCFGSGPIDSTGKPAVLGTLNPLYPTSITVPKAVINGTPTAVYNFMKDYGLAKALPPSPLLDNAGNTYVLQFNPSLSATPVQVNACVVMVPGTACIPTNSPLPTSSKALIWRAQVAVRLKDPTQGQVFKSRLGANCLSDGNAASIVDPCTAPNSMAKFLVWERLPSFASPNSNSPLWLSLPQLKQFNLQYTHDQMYELNGTAGNQYYLCGG